MHTPERHVVMSFVSADDASAAVLLLLHQLGLASGDVASYTPGQMRARAASVLGRACPPTPPGLEPELVVTQRELARLGHSFVLVRAGRESLLPGIRSIAAEAHAHSLQTSTGGPPAARPVYAVARGAVRGLLGKALAAEGRHPIPWSEESRPSVRPDR